MYCIFVILMRWSLVGPLYSHQPFIQKPNRDIYMADIIAMVCLFKDPGLANRKRLYINSEKELAGYFENIDFEKLEKVFISIDQAKPYDINHM